jgi:hypothetical protein
VPLLSATTSHLSFSRSGAPPLTGVHARAGSCACCSCSVFSHLELLSGGSNLRWGAAGFSFDADGGTVTLQVRHRASCHVPETRAHSSS